MEEKFGIGILIHNHICITFLAKSVPCNRSSVIDYEEILGIIEDYSMGLDFSTKLLLKSDSLLAVRSLFDRFTNLSEFGALGSSFLAQIDRGSSIFSHVKRAENVLTHLLARTILDFDVSFK